MVLFIVDAQKDFADPKGSLYVNGADDSCKRTAAFIRNNIDTIDHIVLTMDTHRVNAIFHPTWWKMADGGNVPPLTSIRLSDIDSGKYYTDKDPEWSRAYVEALEKQGGVHTVWPQHCVIGTWGYSIDDEILSAVHEWEIKRGGVHGAEYVSKGANPKVEHFGAFQAEVSIPTDPSTQANMSLINRLKEFGTILICGQARNVCVLQSVKQMLKLSPAGMGSKMVLLEDCMDDVPNFPTTADEDYAKASEAGVSFTKSSLWTNG